jgi:RNA-binding protein
MDEDLDLLSGVPALPASRKKSSLAPHQRAHLKALAHPLKPVVQIGTKGVGDTLIAQIEEQLARHELLKLRVNSECGLSPVEVWEELGRRLRCELVQQVGRVLVVYRRHPSKPRIALPPRVRPVDRAARRAAASAGNAAPAAAEPQG